MSYPWFWDYTRAKPNDPDLAGTYRILKLRIDIDLARSVRENNPLQILHADHTVTFKEFPIFDLSGETVDCRLTGTAHWSLTHFDSAPGWSIQFDKFRSASKPSTPDCDKGATSWEILILGQHSPYRLYTIVGDPDSDTGVEYERLSN
jgi:hypothetical protein